MVRAQLSATFMSCVTMTTVDDRARVEILDEREDLATGLGIEIAGRLVGQQDRRIDRQRSRDRHALALTARQLLGQMREAGGRAARASSSSVARSWTFDARPAAEMQRQPDILQTRQRRQQVEELKDEPDLVAPHARQRIVGQTGERFAVDPDLAGRRTVEAANEVEQRGLPGARRPDDRHHLASRDRQRDVVEGGDVAFAWELFGNALELDDVVHGAWLPADYVNTFTKVSNVVDFAPMYNSRGCHDRDLYAR